MQKKVRYTTILTIVSLIASVGVSSAFLLTRNSIKERDLAVRTEALYVVLPGLEGQPEVIIPVDIPDSEPVFKGLNREGKLIGYAACGEAQGYSSKIKVMVGVDPEHEHILGIDILSQKETPGLGTKIIEVESTSTLWSVISNALRKLQKKDDIESWHLSSGDAGTALRPWFQEQFKQKTYNQLIVSKMKDAEKITAITGATISTKAVIDAVKNAIDKIINSSQYQKWKIE
ncbi:MAG: FMN-binding protein [Candidatus Brocadiaceae bacterium]|nr:FMN-binding protein [Candidatus Brocadiaceae bacterium]